jgi:LacI family transcriptional regulator
MQKLNYVPNMLARSFRAGFDAALGVAVPDIADPFFAAMIRSIEEVASSRGMAVIVSSLGHDPDRERPNVEALLRRQIIGLIVAPIAHDHSYLVPWQVRTPIVFVDRAPSKLTAIFVGEDDQGGAYEAVTHLIRQGHRRIAFIGDSTYVPTTRRRLKGYRAALLSSGLDMEQQLVCLTAAPGDRDVREAIDLRGAMELLDSSRAPTAFFSSNPRCTIALVPALQQAGRTDVGLVGFGDFPMAAALQPAVTVIDQDPDSLGRVAVERLVERVEAPDKRPRQRTVLPVKLIERGSGELRPSSGGTSPRPRVPA